VTTNESAVCRRRHLSEDAGDGSVTPSASLHPPSKGKPSPGTLRRKGREANQETPGAVTWGQA